MRRLTLPPLVLLAALLCNCGDPVSPLKQAPAGFYYEPRTDVPMDAHLMDSLAGMWRNGSIHGGWLEFARDGAFRYTDYPSYPIPDLGSASSARSFAVDGALVTIHDSIGVRIGTLGACFEPDRQPGYIRLFECASPSCDRLLSIVGRSWRKLPDSTAATWR